MPETVFQAQGLVGTRQRMSGRSRKVHVPSEERPGTSRKFYLFYYYMLFIYKIQYYILYKCILRYI